MRFIVMLMALVVSGCGLGETPCGPGGPESARMRLLATDVEFSRYALEVNPAGAFAAVLDVDAVFLPMNYPTLYGREDIVEFFTGSEGVRIGWTPAEAVVAQGCDIGYTFGAWTALADEGGEAPVAYSGKYLGTWRYYPDTGWRLAAYMQNADPMPRGAQQLEVD